jgi:hypothetical protein
LGTTFYAAWNIFNTEGIYLYTPRRNIDTAWNIFNASGAVIYTQGFQIIRFLFFGKTAQKYLRKDRKIISDAFCVLTNA